jgi:hypothetical protein
MSTVRKNELVALKVALSKVDAMIDASNGEPSLCATFDERAGMGVEPFTVEQKRHIRVYLDSWIREPLAAAIAGIEGERRFANDQVIDSHARDFGRTDRWLNGERVA